MRIKNDLSPFPILDNLLPKASNKENMLSMLEWVKYLQQKLYSEINYLDKDSKPKFSEKKIKQLRWQHVGNESKLFKNDFGGGISLMGYNNLFEKYGINISCIYDKFSQEFSKEIPGAESDPRFWACGLSTVIHPRNPHIPSAHMNCRYIVTSKSWFGAVADINPMGINYPKLENNFINSLKNIANDYQPKFGDKLKQNCDQYFYIPHREKNRGAGGIFCDYLNSDDKNKKVTSKNKEANFKLDFNFIKNISLEFISQYGEIVNKLKNKSWSNKERNKQLIARGHYVEYNLIYDRGTKFGLKTLGNTEAILMSLPPTASWPIPAK